MIYTVTLSPALDYLLWLDRFVPGELNRADKTAFRAGGKGINVSVILQRLGLPGVCLGFTAGFVGDEIIRLLDEEGMRHDFIRLSEGCTRINVKVKAGTESEINAYGPRIPREAVDRLMTQTAALEPGDILVLSGNPPKEFPEKIYTELLRTASGKGIKTVLDTSGKYLTDALSGRPYLIKPNLHELEEVTGRALTTPEQIAEAALRLREKGAANVLVSMGKDGALLAADDGGIRSCGIPGGELIDSTGAGDSMAAGFIAEEIFGGDRSECLRFAVACGSASAYSFGLADAEKINEVLSQTPVPVLMRPGADAS